MKIIFLLTVFIIRVIFTQDSLETDFSSQTERKEQYLVNHFDCSNPKTPKKYAINHIPTCELTEEDIETNPAKLHIYQKVFVREIEGYRCEVHYMYERFFCDSSDDDFRDDMFVHNMQKPVPVPPIECLRVAKQLEKTIGCIPTDEEENNVHNDCASNIKLHIDGLDFEIYVQKFEEWRYLIQRRGRSVKKSKSDCWKKGHIQKYQFRTLISKLNISYVFPDMHIVMQGNVLPCKFEDGGCPATNRDPVSYAWDAEETCVLQKYDVLLGHMLKWDSRMFFIIDTELCDEISFKNTSDPCYGTGSKIPKEQQRGMKIEIFNEDKWYCGSQQPLKTTSSQNLFVRYDGGFDVATGKKIQISWTADPKQMEHDAIAVKLHNRNLIDPITNQTVAVIDYDTHLNLKIDYMMYSAARKSRYAEIEILKKQCENERILRFTILTLAIQDPIMAGYLLTGKRDQFLTMEGSIAWLYECPEVISPLDTTSNRCYDKIPIDFESKLQFVDPISRQTFEFSAEIECNGTEENIFNLDPEDPNTWVMINPNPRHVDPPNYFSMRTIKHITTLPTISASNAGLYSEEEITKFWTKIVSNKFSETIFKQFAIRLSPLEQSADGQTITKNWKGIRMNGFLQTWYMDNLLSPEFFRNQFLQFFGWFALIATQLGGLFAFGLLLNFLFKLTCSIFNTFEIHELTGQTFTFGKSFLAGTFNLFYMSALASMNEKQKDQDNNLSKPDRKQNDKNEKPHKKTNQIEAPPYEIEAPPYV